MLFESILILLTLICAINTRESVYIKFPNEHGIVFPSERGIFEKQSETRRIIMPEISGELHAEPTRTQNGWSIQIDEIAKFRRHPQFAIEIKLNDILILQNRSERQEQLRMREFPPPPKPGDPYPPPPGGRWNRRRTGRKRLCEKKYSEYVERIFPGEEDTIADANDEDFDGRVLAQPGEYPHMSAIGFKNEKDEIEFKCGGSLISEKFILTAAHCTSVNGQRPTLVRIGAINLIDAEQRVEPQTRLVQNIYNHPAYNSDLYYNDISLIELNELVELTIFVRPIRLWTYTELPTTLAFAMGYGATGFAKGATYRLTDMNLTIVPNDECNRELPELDETPNGILGSQMCAHDYLLNRDTCQGDSGGPLQVNLPGRRRKNRIHYHLIGITSYGVFCRSAYPSVYTRVSSFLDWIERVVWRSEYRTATENFLN